MATFLERAAHLVNRMCSLLCLLVFLVVLGEKFGSDSAIFWPLLSFTFCGSTCNSITC